MNCLLKKSWTFKLLLLITTSIVLAFTINQAQAQEGDTTKLKALKSEVYYDKNSGLEWLAGPDKATSWYDAKKWVESLISVAGGGWRMPTRKELETLYQKGEKCHIKPFLKTTGCWVWSGETRDSSTAWGYDYSIDIGAGLLHGGSCSGEDFFKRDDSTKFFRGFAVRSRK
ncbi:MAG: DUF1566 domain-containing protein [Desulfobacteraceae bacterium]|nr:DUF1566 domain-containing protein [Desulfobacteraceae bacterium]